MKKEISPGAALAAAVAVLVLLAVGFFLWDHGRRQAQTQRIEDVIQAGAGPRQP